MAQFNQQLDPNHAQKRAKLSGLGVGLLAVGVPCAIIGFCLFISVFFTSSREFFANPDDTMDSNARRAVIGMILMAGGGFASMIGLNLLGFAQRGKIARYQAGELMPLAKDMAQDAAPVIGQVVREIAQSAREGLQSETASPPDKIRHSCGALNDADDKFCKACGQPLAGPLCPNCGRPNDPDAKFCDKCGTPIRTQQ